MRRTTVRRAARGRRRRWIGVLAWVTLGVSSRSHAAPTPTPTASEAVWLSVDWLVPTEELDAARATVQRGLSPGALPVEPGPPGLVVGRADTVPDALAWVARHAFDSATSDGNPSQVATVTAPTPAGALLRAHGVFVRAFVITGATPEGGVRPLDWPIDPTALLPDALAWIPAALTVARAPLFAAPAPSIPPAAHRHAMAQRSGGLFVLGWLDRCDDAGTRCLRWAQVVARNKDRFVPGYLPAYMVAPQDQWVRAEAALPRAQLLRSGTRATLAEWLLLVRDRHGQLHRKRITAPLVEGRFPHASLQLQGEWVELAIEGLDETLRVAADASMDLRLRQ